MRQYTGKNRQEQMLTKPNTMGTVTPTNSQQLTATYTPARKNKIRNTVPARPTQLERIHYTTVIKGQTPETEHKMKKKLKTQECIVNILIIIISQRKLQTTAENTQENFLTSAHFNPIGYLHELSGYQN